MDKIFIQGIEIEAIIGIYANERITKQTVIVDVAMYCHVAQASTSDNIKHALDYHKVCQDIYHFVSHSSFNLIESLAEAIAQRVLSYKQVEKTCVKLSKPQALKQAKNVGIEITRQRS